MIAAGRTGLSSARRRALRRAERVDFNWGVMAGSRPAIAGLYHLVAEWYSSATYSQLTRFSRNAFR